VEPLQRLLRPGSAQRRALGRLLSGVACADSVACTALVLVATLLLRTLAAGDPAFGSAPELQPTLHTVQGGLAVPLVLVSLLLGVSLTFSAPGLLRRLGSELARAHNLALGTLGVLAGAAVPLPVLQAAWPAALVFCGARLLGKWTAVRWTLRREEASARAAASVAPGSPGPQGAGAAPAALAAATHQLGLGLAPAGMLVVALILLVRDEPALQDSGDLLLALGVWATVINATAGPLLARLMLDRAERATGLPASGEEGAQLPRLTPEESPAARDDS
jgi:hypothetical protein